MNRIPNEILGEIASHLHSDEHKSFGLVAWRFYNALLPTLFKFAHASFPRYLLHHDKGYELNAKKSQRFQHEVRFAKYLRIYIETCHCCVAKCASLLSTTGDYCAQFQMVQKLEIFEVFDQWSWADRFMTIAKVLKYLPNLSRFDIEMRDATDVFIQDLEAALDIFKSGSGIAPLTTLNLTIQSPGNRTGGILQHRYPRNSFFLQRCLVDIFEKVSKTIKSAKLETPWMVSVSEPYFTNATDLQDKHPNWDQPLQLWSLPSLKRLSITAMSLGAESRLSRLYSPDTLTSIEQIEIICDLGLPEALEMIFEAGKIVLPNATTLTMVDTEFDHKGLSYASSSYITSAAMPKIARKHCNEIWDARMDNLCSWMPKLANATFRLQRMRRMRARYAVLRSPSGGFVYNKTSNW